MEFTTLAMVSSQTGKVRLPPEVCRALGVHPENMLGFEYSSSYVIMRVVPEGKKCGTRGNIVRLLPSHTVVIPATMRARLNLRRRTCLELRCDEGAKCLMIRKYAPSKTLRPHLQMLRSNLMLLQYNPEYRDDPRLYAESIEIERMIAELEKHALLLDKLYENSVERSSL